MTKILCNKLKAIQKLYKKFIAPSVVEKDRSLDQDFDFTEIKKKLADGKFKSTLEYSIMSKLGGSSYRSNSFYFLDDKEQKLLDRIYGGLRKIVNVMDKAQLENINEDGHTDVASSKRKVMIMVQDSNKLLNKLNGMNKEDSLPSWWSDKITLSQNYLEKATNYLLNPVESVNEDVFAIVDKFNQSKQDYDQVYFKDNNLNKVKNHLKKLGKKYGKMNLIRVKTNGKMSLVESVNEARLDPKQTLQQLGGNRFIAMTGAKNLAVDKSKNELHMKIMRNAKGISHVRIRLTSMDLYDMEFLQVRAGRIKIKSKEKGVYGDQLGKMFKKNTGLNVRL